MKTPKNTYQSVRTFCVAITILILVSPTLATAEDNSSGVDQLVQSSNVFFILIGAVMILAMHGGFAFLEVGSVRKKIKSMLSIRSCANGVFRH